MAGYWRQFVLSDSFDAEKADGSIRNGVIGQQPQLLYIKIYRLEIIFLK